MAINLQFGAPLEVAQAGMLAGMGEYAKYQEQQALRQQAMALEEARFREQQEQNTFRNQFAETELGLNQFNRNREFGYGVHSDQQKLALQQQAMQQEAMQQSASNAMQMANAEANRQSQMQQQQVVTDRQRMAIRAQVERDRLMQVERQAASDWEAIMKQAATPGGFRPGQFEQAVQRHQELYGAMGQPQRAEMIGEPAQYPESLGSFYQEYGLPYDEETGELLVPPNIANQIIQSKTNERIAAQRAENEQRRMVIEAKEARLEEVRSEIEKADARMKELDDMRREYIIEQGTQAEESIKERESVFGKQMMTDVSAWKKSQVSRKRGQTPVEQPTVPEGSYLSPADAEYLRSIGVLKPGTKIYINGQPIRVR